VASTLHIQGNKSIIKLEWSAFYNNINEMITLAQIEGDLFSFINLEKFQSAGTQLIYEYAYQHLKINIGTAIIGRYNRFSSDFEVREFYYSPEARANLIYEFKKQKINISFFYKYTGALPSFRLDSEANLSQLLIEDFHTADLILHKYLFKNKLRISLGCKNLFDVSNIQGFMADGAHSEGGNSMPIAMGRLYFLGINYQLNK
jgi:outer membrane receptor for ferrienterochelin and colicins